MSFLQDAAEGEFKLERLEGDRCRWLRPLWEEVFWEDSKEFTDYYFREKAAGNHGYALWARNGALAAMLYLSPYPVMIRRKSSFGCREINYVVGVATKEEYRHRGCMDRLLREALLDMYGKGQPFTFLMPADPAIYRPYQFAYIYRRPEYRLAEEWAGRLGRDVRPEPGRERASTEERAGQEKGFVREEESGQEKEFGLEKKSGQEKGIGLEKQAGQEKGIGLEKKSWQEERIGLEKQTGQEERFGLEKQAGQEERFGLEKQAGQEERDGLPEDREGIRIMAADSGRLPELAGFAQEYLERNYDVFIRRDEKYYRRMEKELQAEQGGIVLLEEQGCIKGYFLYARETEETEIQEAVLDGERGGGDWPVTETGERKPVIMARVVNAEAMLSLLWAQDEEIAVDIRVFDPVLEGNNGVWECIFAEDGTKVRRRQEREADRQGRAELTAASMELGSPGDEKAFVEPGRPAEAEISVDALVSWAFGCREAGECFRFREGIGEESKERILERLRKVGRPGKVWINEVV